MTPTDEDGADVVVADIEVAEVAVSDPLDDRAGVDAVVVVIVGSEPRPQPARTTQATVPAIRVIERIPGGIGLCAATGSVCRRRPSGLRGLGGLAHGAGR